MTEDENEDGWELNYRLIYTADRQQKVWDSWIYGHQRKDILMIAVASAGIYLCLETVKYLLDKGFCVSPLIPIGAIALLFSIIANLVSQHLSTKIHFDDFNLCQLCIALDDVQLKENKDKLEKIRKAIKKVETKLELIEKVSFVLLLFGLLLIIAFYMSFIF